MIAKGIVLTGIRGATAVGSLLLAVSTLRVFGAGPLADALFVAQLIPLLFGRRAWDMLVKALLPCLFEQKNREEEILYVRQASSLLLAGGILMAVVLYAAAPLLVAGLAPGFDLETRALTLRMFRNLCPCLPFLVGCGLYGTLLASSYSHVAQAASRLLWRVGALVSIWTLGREQGPEVFAGSLTLITACQFLLLLGAAALKGLPVRPARLGSGTRERFAPLFYGIWIGLVVLGLELTGTALDRAVLSTLPPGSIALFGYAARVAHMVPSLLMSGLLIQLMPGMARVMVRTGATRRVTRETSKFAFQMGMFLSVYFLSVAHPICGLLGEAADLDPKEVQVLWLCLTVLLLAMPAAFANRILYTGFRFERNLRLLARVGIFTLVLRLPLLLTLKSLGPSGIALASISGMWITFFFLWWWTGRNRSGDGVPFRVPVAPVLLVGYLGLVLLMFRLFGFPNPWIDLAVKTLLGVGVCAMYLRVAVPGVQRIVETTEA